MKPQVTPAKMAAVTPRLQKKKPRGRPFPKGHTFGFKKGQSGSPGGKSHVHRKFADRIVEELAQPAPPEVRRTLKLRRSATIYDAVVRAAVLRAATGDSAAFTTIRETTEGKLPNRNVNMTIAMEKFLEDPGFRAFLEEQHGEYLKLIGGDSGQRTLTADYVFALRSAEAEED